MFLIVARSMGVNMGLFSRKPVASIPPPILSWRGEVDFTNTLTSAVKDLASNNRDGLCLLCGALFALQQDTKKATQFNLWSRTNIVQEIARAHISVPTPRVPTAGLAQIIDVLHEMMKLNEQMLNRYRDEWRDNPPPNVSPKDLQTQVAAAGLRNRAAAIWLLTVMTPTEMGSSMVRLAATNIWLLATSVPGPDVYEFAKLFTGTFFNGVESPYFDLAEWPTLSR